MTFHYGLCFWVADYKWVKVYNKLALLISTKEHCIELKAVISQGHNLCKLKYISLEEVKISYFQKRFQSEVTESNLYRLYLG